MVTSALGTYTQPAQNIPASPGMVLGRFFRLGSLAWAALGSTRAALGLRRAVEGLATAVQGLKRAVLGLTRGLLCAGVSHRSKKKCHFF